MARQHARRAKALAGPQREVHVLLRGDLLVVVLAEPQQARLQP